MPTSTPPLGGGPEPAPPAPPLSAEGDDDDDSSSPLLDLLQRFPDLSREEVLEGLDPVARALDTPEMWKLVASHGSVVDAWRLTGVCRAARDG